MSDIDHDEEFEKAFEGFGEDKPVDQPKDDPIQEDGGKDDTEPKESKKNEQPAQQQPQEDPANPGQDPAKPAEEGAQPPTPPTTPPVDEAPEAPQPLSEDSIRRLLNEVRTEERMAGKELDLTTQEVLEAYYPTGLSNVLVDQSSGKELRTPQDVVDASNGTMSMEQATQWLMNEQYKLDQDIAKIKDDAKNLAELNVTFKSDAVAALQKYEPLFTAYPHLQKKVYDKLMKQVEIDSQKGIILKAPDVMEFYDDQLEYPMMAFEQSQGKPATSPVTPVQAPPAQPGMDDRLDEGGDGGVSPVDDPNDFAQQVNKALSEPL